MNGIQLAQHIGVSYRRIDFWTRQGYLRPTNPDCGIGTPRVYPMAEVEVANRMALLVRAGLTPRAAHALARRDTVAITQLEEALGAVLA